MNSTLQESLSAIKSTNHDATIEAIDRLMSQLVYADMSCLWEVLRPEQFDLNDQNKNSLQTIGI